MKQELFPESIVVHLQLPSAYQQDVFLFIFLPAAVQLELPPNNGPEGPRTRHPVIPIPFDGVYLLVVHTTSEGTGINLSYTAEITIEMESDYGYLSAVGECQHLWCAVLMDKGKILK